MRRTRGLRGGTAGLAVPPTTTVTAGDMPTLMLLYSGGFAGVSLVSVVQNWRAYRWRDGLGLDAPEREITRGEIRAHVISLTIAAGSILLVVLDPQLSAWAGLVYFLMGPTQAANGIVTGRRAERLAVGAAAAAPAV